MPARMALTHAPRPGLRTTLGRAREWMPTRLHPPLSMTHRRIIVASSTRSSRTARVTASRGSSASRRAYRMSEAMAVMSGL